ncbi:PAQR family membrane homeostasis protein TrhA [Paraferrimonas sedimenticola]|uniref:Hemolysin III family protein n=2 Tax=Paraferrimonas sedimenticola TaxID=375674 RepID=A0AA37RT52_9GAMM|nr:hemolysin III family protein [Paraferrimonas sedimenticola]GLP95058.1 hemolysin III family protein [Paraferrimonas sedimenticola]
MASDYSPLEERANAFSHGLGILLALAGMGYLWQQALQAQLSPLHSASLLLYGASLVLLFSCSTLYHTLAHTQAKSFLKTLDHCAIFILIAGTYTPTLLALNTELAYWLLAIIWGLAIAGVLLKLKFVYRFKRLSLTVYLIMGWLALVAAYQLWDRMPAEVLLWLLAGGIAYSIGAVFYAAKQLKFGHAVWHLFVLLGAACHYLAVTHLVPLYGAS